MKKILSIVALSSLSLVAFAAGTYNDPQPGKHIDPKITAPYDGSESVILDPAKTAQNYYPGQGRRN